MDNNNNEQQQQRQQPGASGTPQYPKCAVCGSEQFLYHDAVRKHAGGKPIAAVQGWIVGLPLKDTNDKLVVVNGKMPALQVIIDFCSTCGTARAVAAGGIMQPVMQTVNRQQRFGGLAG